MEIYNIFKTVGTSEIFEGAVACIHMSETWHAYTVTLQHDAIKENYTLTGMSLTEAFMSLKYGFDHP